MNPQSTQHDALLDLLVLQATEGLDPREARELERLLEAQDEFQDGELETSVAAILLAAESDPARPSSPMSPELAERIMERVTESNVIPLSAPRAPASRPTGWWAAAACAALAVWGWWPRLINPPAQRAEPAAVTRLTPEQERARLLESGRAIQAAWSPGNDASAGALTGDVVFDPVTQRGYLLFRGIPVNDPRLERYQLWVADAARALPEPVDGGVFDAPRTTAAGDVLIPFETKLPVGKPAAFVITVEKPEGVVVSRQERVLALAKVPAG
jgi:hypothetical protein